MHNANGHLIAHSLLHLFLHYTYCKINCIHFNLAFLFGCYRCTPSSFRVLT
uniref:Uncharacterized protein n=1 Tax=Anguilla anguilla TaxID=7936 RepID=A0A0E9TQL9_ANGAN